MKQFSPTSIFVVALAIASIHSVTGRPNSNSSETPELKTVEVTSTAGPTTTTTTEAVQTTTNKTKNESKHKSSSSTHDGPIRKCDHNDDIALNSCLKLVLEDLKPRLKEGVPEINLPPMDPLKIDNIAFQHGSGPVKVIAVFSNVEVSGLSNFTKSDFGVDTKRRTLDFALTVPQMAIVGTYQLSGNLFFFPIGGKGNFWLNIGGVNAKGSGKLGLQTKENHKQIVVRKTDLDLDIENIKVHLTNLFNGDRLLGQVINNFLNENSKDIFNEVKPQIGAQVGEMVSLLTNKALSALSADHFDDIALDDTF